MGYETQVISAGEELDEIDNTFDLYLIELNLGRPAMAIVGSSIKIYRSIPIGSKFIGFTSTQGILDAAATYKFPSCLTQAFEDDFEGTINSLRYLCVKSNP